MINDINNLDPEDIGLKQLMGDRFQDLQEAGKTKKEEQGENITPAAKTAQKPNQKPMNDSEWHPVKPEPNWLDNLKECAKSAVIFGGLNMLIFYWQQAGLMDSSIAIPSMCVCAALAGLGIGKYATRGNNW